MLGFNGKGSQHGWSWIHGRRGAHEPQAPHAADQTSRCWKESGSHSANEGGGDEGGDPIARNCSVELAGDERYSVLCKELQQLPPEQQGT